MWVGSFSRDLPPFLRHCLWDKFDLSLTLSLRDRLLARGHRWQIVKKSVVWGSWGHFGSRKSSKNAKRTPFLAPKYNLFVENRNLLIFDENAPRLSETYEFEVQGAKRTPLLAPKSHLFIENQNLFIFDANAPRSSETYEFEVQGPRK